MSQCSAKRLPRGRAAEIIIDALHAARHESLPDLTMLQLREKTKLSTATLYDAVQRLAASGKVKTFRDNSSGRLQVRVALRQ